MHATALNIASHSISFIFSLHYEEDWSGDHSAVLDGDQGNVVLYWSIQEEYIYFKVGTYIRYSSSGIRHERNDLCRLKLLVENPRRC